MIESFELNPPKTKRRKNPWISKYRYTRKSKPKKRVSVPKYFRKRAKSTDSSSGKAWRSVVKHYAKKMGGRPGFKAAAKKWRSLKASGVSPSKVLAQYKSNKSNPYVGKYSYTRKALSTKRVSVPKYYRKRARRNPYRYKISPVLANRAAPLYRIPALSPNPFLAGELAMVVPTIKKFIEPTFLLETVLPLTGGLVASQAIAAQAAKLLKVDIATKGIAKYGFGLGATALGSILTAILTKRYDIAEKVLAGGSLGVLYSILVDYLPTGKVKATLLPGLSGFAQDAENLTEELKAKIEEAVKREVEAADEGISSFVTQETLPRSVPGGMAQAYVTKEDLPEGVISIDDYLGEI